MTNVLDAPVIEPATKSADPESATDLVDDVEARLIASRWPAGIRRQQVTRRVVLAADPIGDVEWVSGAHDVAQALEPAKDRLAVCHDYWEAWIGDGRAWTRVGWGLRHRTARARLRALRAAIYVDVIEGL